MAIDHIATLRRFNRSYTQRIGVLSDRFLGMDRALGQARLLFEIGPDGASVLELRRRLGLDSGYMSRLLRVLEDDGLIELEPDPADRRRRIASLTEAGRTEYDELDQRSDALAERLLAPLSDSQRSRLTDAIETADRLLRAATASFEVVDPGADAALWALGRYFEYLDATFDTGFDPGDVTADLALFRAPVGAFVLARIDGEPVACGAVQTIEPRVGEIKRMWVDDLWRGAGLGRRMVVELETIIGGMGHHTVRLDTNGALTSAISLYERMGYQAVERYNDNPYAHHWFEKTIGSDG
jgi:DNA-binding MarR family transcriptional regulator/N-acetylglutamate synthase-like GNAT family acetyltransferase